MTLSNLFLLPLAIALVFLAARFIRLRPRRAAKEPLNSTLGARPAGIDGSLDAPPMVIRSDMLTMELSPSGLRYWRPGGDGYQLPWRDLSEVQSYDGGFFGHPPGGSISFLDRNFMDRRSAYHQTVPLPLSWPTDAKPLAELLNAARARWGALA